MTWKIQFPQGYGLSTFFWHKGTSVVTWFDVVSNLFKLRPALYTLILLLILYYAHYYFCWSYSSTRILYFCGPYADLKTNNVIRVYIYWTICNTDLALVTFQTSSSDITFIPTTPHIKVMSWKLPPLDQTFAIWWQFWKSRNLWTAEYLRPRAPYIP